MALEGGECRGGQSSPHFERRETLPDTRGRALLYRFGRGLGWREGLKTHYVRLCLNASAYRWCFRARCRLHHAGAMLFEHLELYVRIDGVDSTTRVQNSGTRQVCLMSPPLFLMRVIPLMMDAMEGLHPAERGHVDEALWTVLCTDDMALLAKQYARVAEVVVKVDGGRCLRVGPPQLGRGHQGPAM